MCHRLRRLRDAIARYALPTFVVAALRAHKRSQAERRLAVGPAWDPTELICDAGDGSPVQPDLYTRAFKRIATQAGLPEMRLHGARHLHATLQLESGVHPAIVSQALGHASPAFTAAVYQHVMPTHAQAAAAVIDAAFGDSAGR